MQFHTMLLNLNYLYSIGNEDGYAKILRRPNIHF